MSTLLLWSLLGGISNNQTPTQENKYATYHMICRSFKTRKEVLTLDLVNLESSIENWEQKQIIYIVKDLETKNKYKIKNADCVFHYYK